MQIAEIHANGSPSTICQPITPGTKAASSR